MSLFEIKSKLYRKEDRENPPSMDDFRHSRNLDGLAKEENRMEDVWTAPQKGFNEKKKKIIKFGLIILGGIILVSGAFWGIYKFRQSAFADDRVSVSISGPSNIRSGKKADWEINFVNNNRADLGNAVLKLSYPENFKPEDIPGFKAQGPTSGTIEMGTLKAHMNAKFVFSGKAYSPRGSLIYIQAELVYTPSNFNSRFVAQKRFRVNVSSSPITLDFSYPQAVSNGDEINYIIDYKNTGEEDFSGVSLKAEYQDGFSFISSDPAVSSGNDNWYVGDLLAGGSGRLLIKGRLEGNRNEVKTLKVSIGASENGNFTVFNEGSAGVKIAASPLFISQSVNKQSNLIVNPGDTLRFEIFYRNDGDVLLRDAIVTEKLNSAVLDFSSLDLPNGGDYDSSARTIVWKAVDYPELKNINPGQSGTIAFTIRIKDPLPVKLTNGKNFIVSSLAKIDSPDIATPVAMNKIISSNTVNMRVNSQLGLSVLGFYTDKNIPNTGPLPPKVDQETTYTLYWTVANASNDLENAKVEASLPAGITLAGKISPENEKFEYNERTNLITWDIGKLEAGVGIIKPARTLAFQIKIKPSIDQLSKSPGILGKSVFSGRDLFTSMDLKTEASEKNISLEEDKTIGSGGGRVVN